MARKVARFRVALSRMSSIKPPAGLRRDPTWNFRVVGAFVPKATAKARDAHGLHTAEIILNWPAIVGPQLAAYTSPRRIRWPKAPGLERETQRSVRSGSVQSGSVQSAQRGQKTTLEVWVAGGRAHEIPYLKGPIIARINAYFGYRAVTDIMPVDGPVIRPKLPAARKPPTVQEIAEVAAANQLTADDPLAQALAKLGANIQRGKAGPEPTR
jgi:hypothetical protein